MPTAATAPPTGATDPIRLFLWSLGNGTNERALCETLADFFKPLCPLADLVDREICVDYKVAYTARCGSGAFRFAGEGTFLYLTLSLLWVLSVALLLRFWRISYIPDSAVTIAVGWVTGALLSLTPDGGSRRRFDEQVFFDVLLPVIIFEAGYNMNRRAMRKQLAQVAALAVLGTCVSFLVTTGLMLGFASLAGRHLPLLDAATFGALISSTDPVAVVAVFAQFGVPAPLYTLIFGESTLNDAVAVALYGSLKWVYQHPTLARGDKVQHLLQSFFAVSFGSTAVGLACGCAVGLAWKRLPIFVHPVLETLVYIISALLPYYLAEEAGWSGVIAILFAAVAMATYAHPNLSKQAGYHVTFIVECLSRLFEAAIFGYLGTQMVINSEKLVWSPLAMAALFAVLVARACNVFPILFLNNAVSAVKVPLAHQFVVWFSGFRGALAFALAVTVPEWDKVTQLGSHWAGEILAWTTLIIVVNVFCFGAATPFVLRAAVLQPMNREEALSSREEEEAQSWLDAWHERVVRPWFVKRQVEDATAGAQEEDQTEDVGDDGFVHVRRLTSRLAQSPPAAGLRAHQQALLS